MRRSSTSCGRTWLTQGPAFRASSGSSPSTRSVPHAVAVNNATAALHIACLALGLGPGRRLWTIPITLRRLRELRALLRRQGRFRRYRSATLQPVRRRLWNASSSRRASRARCRRSSCRCTSPASLRPARRSRALARRVTASGSSRMLRTRSARATAGVGIGCALLPTSAVFSFHPVKIITTGEGGMITTNDAELAERMRLLRSHGITRDPAQMADATQGGVVLRADRRSASTTA